MFADMTNAQIIARLRASESRLITLRNAAAAYLQQDARYDDLTEECAAAKRALRRAVARSK